MMYEIRNPSDKQEDLYKRIAANLQQKQAYEVHLTDALVAPGTDPISIGGVSGTVQSALNSQNIRISDARAEGLGKRCVNYVAGQKWLEHTLDHYEAVEGRPEDLGQVDGFNVTLFADAKKELLGLDKRVLEIQKRIDDAKAARKNELEILHEKNKPLKERVAKNNEQLTELSGEMSALAKLLSGVKKLFAIFSTQQVKVEDADPLDFLDSHFDLGQIITDSINDSATLTFEPPEFYDFDEDMGVQVTRMHGLDDRETEAQTLLQHAVGVVRQEASEIRARSTHTGLQHQKTQNLDVEEREDISIERERVSSHSEEKTGVLSSADVRTFHRMKANWAQTCRGGSENNDDEVEKDTAPRSKI
jgi:golgin subfamily B member 1